MEDLGIRVLLGRTTTAILGNGHVEGVALSDDSCLDADLVVVAAGIRPNVELGVQGRRCTSTAASSSTTTWRPRDPDIFAVGECVEHRGVCYGLVAPLFEQGKVLAATITGNKGPTYTGTVQAAKLKIMGVDVFSAGDWSEQNAEPVRYEDRALGVYKKLTVRDGKLAGVILVGDTSDSHRYMDWLRTGADLTGAAAAPAVSAAGGRRRPRRRRDGRQRHRLRLRRRDQGHDHPARSTSSGVNTLSQLKECTRASTGCGSCTSLCQDLLRAVAPEFEDEAKKVICGCLPFAEDQLRDILRSQRLKSVQEVLEIYGNGHRLRGLQAGAQLHARHALVRRPRRGSLGALHQRPRARQHPEGRHVLGRSRASAAA